MGVVKEDVYVLVYDDDRMEWLVDNMNVNMIGVKEMGIKYVVGNVFNKKGDEFCNKIYEIGFFEDEVV